MKMLCTASIAALLVTFGAPALVQTASAANPKLSKADCQSLWGRAASSGSLSSAQAQPYVTNFAKVDSNADGKLSSSEFLAGCQRGLVHDSASSGASEGTSGAAGKPGTTGKKY